VRFYERILRGNLGSGGGYGASKLPPLERERENAYDHRLQIISETKIDCVKCGAEWKDMGLGR
jgi:hypothetical protein